MLIGSSNSELFNLPANDLVTHSVVIGRTGSGKTGLIISLIEEVASCGIGSVIVDPKGDLTNLALMPTCVDTMAHYSEQSLHAPQLFAERERGLSNFGLSHEHVKQFVSIIPVEIYEPGASYNDALTINVFPTMMPQPCQNITRARDAAMRSVSTILDAIGVSKRSLQPAVVFLTEAALYHWSRGVAFPLRRWADVLLDPPEALLHIGGMWLGDFLPDKDRAKLARALVSFRYQSAKWLSGPVLDLNEVVDNAKIVVLSLRHLNEGDRQFFGASLMNKVLDFMSSAPASKSLRLLVVFDEARGYLPPHPASPPTKKPICDLLAQGRAHGIGLLIGTQNPMDLDYKALSNVGTWFVGRLRERDCSRDLKTELASRDVDLTQLGDLKTRNFVVITRDGRCASITTRWTYSYLRGPLSHDEIVKYAPNARPASKLHTSRRGHKGSSVSVKGSFWRAMLGF